jgi:peptidoglycan/LPS O-acetylase OafA/YrhL
MSHQRIELLDSFRFLAITSVLFYHFTFRWAFVLPSSHFYGNFAQYGSLGVEFFFVISGFVISYTLENTEGPTAFFKNRFIRLFPPLLLCTLITFIAAGFLDNTSIFPEAHQPANLLPSLTLTNHAIWTLISHHNFFWINGSYWSLWVEVQFYAIAAALYFSGKGKFIRNLVWTTIVISAIKYIPPVFMNVSWGKGNHPGLISFVTNLKEFYLLFNIVYYLPWFVLGSFFHYLFKGYRPMTNKVLDISVLIMLAFLYADHYKYRGWVMHVLVLVFFGLLIYKPKWLGFLDFPLFRRIGVISYTLYLIHEDIGVLLMTKIGPYIGWNPLLPIVMMVLAIGFAELSNRFYEKNVYRWLKKVLFKPAQVTAQVTAVVPVISVLKHPTQITAEYLHSNGQQDHAEEFSDGNHPGGAKHLFDEVHGL